MSNPPPQTQTQTQLLSDLLSTRSPPLPQNPSQQPSQDQYIYIVTLEQENLLMGIDNLFIAKGLYASRASALEAIGARVDDLTQHFGEGFMVDAATGLGYVIPGKIVLRIKMVWRKVGA